jgi:hypothetical protein
MKSIRRLSLTAMFLASTFALTSCEDILGQWDKPVPQEIVNVIVENTGATPEEVTALIKEALSDEAIQAALISGEPIQVEVSGGSSTTASNQTITIPMTTAGAGQNKVVIDLTFTGTISSTEDTPLEFKADTGADANADNSDNQLNINMPAATGLVITINLPKTTVVLTSSGSGTVYKTVNSKTAMETLIISEGVTVEELLIADGTVIVKEGGKVESYVYQPSSNDEKLLIKEDGSVEPQKVLIGDEEKFELRHENGDPYYASNLKVMKSEADYANIFFLNPNPSNNPLKVVTVCDGAVLKTNWIAMETIEGKGTAEIKFRLESVSGYTDDTEYGGEKFYEFNSDMYHVSNIKNIIFSQPEIALSDYQQGILDDKINEGYVAHVPRLNMDVDGSIEDCTFKYNHVHFCPQSGSKFPLVKRCKFDQTGDNNVVEIQMLFTPTEDSYTINFEECEFNSNTIFKPLFLDRQGIIDFTNCTYNGQTLDNLDLLNQIIYGQVTISINGVAKYRSSFDSDSPTKWKVTAIEE